MPNSEELLVHCDGGARGNPGPGGAGCVIEEVAGKDIAGSIAAVRVGAVEIEPGYDGLYGTIHAARTSAQPQKSLFG